LARFRTIAAPAVAMKSAQFAIASVQDGTAAPATKAATFAETQAELTKLNRATAAAATRWQLVPAFEMAEP
ncbi:MAG: hypothetical protein ACREUC_00205, partial [Steroidobacteraceae bacterium]